jgi:hypothetical protein
MNRREILETAIAYVTQDRAATHGGAEDSFAMIADLWNAYLGLELKQQDVCAMMILLKVARIAGNPAHVDSWIDCAGYASLGGEISNGKG